MNRKSLLVVLLAAGLAGCGGVQSSASAAELSRSDVEKLLSNMGESDITIVAITNGIGMLGPTAVGSPNIALAIALGKFRNGVVIEKGWTFYYDKEIGWFYSEVHSVDDSKDHTVDLWTTTAIRNSRIPRSDPTPGVDRGENRLSLSPFFFLSPLLLARLKRSRCSLPAEPLLSVKPNYPSLTLPDGTEPL
jgi:hypothetical protein